MACPIPFSQFLDTVLAIYCGPGHSRRTIAKMRHVLAMMAGLGVQSTADLTTELAARFVRERSAQVGANTVRGELAYLSAACGVAVEEGWLDRPPRFRRVRPRIAAPDRPRAHSLEDVARVLELLRSRADTWTGHRLYALASVVAYAALRRDEALWLMVADVDLATGLLRIVDRRRLKTAASAAPVPICPELAGILAGWLPRCGSPWLFPGVRKRGPWTGGACRARPCDQIRRAGEELGIAGLTLLSLRHTWATHARRYWGLSALEVADVLRHVSPVTQRWYVDPPRPEDLVASVARVSYRAK